MTLRTRLIVAFVLLSVVPLGVVTFYSYTTNVDAMQDVAAREADTLAGVMNQRMQLITAQLSERIEHLADVQDEPASTVQAPAHQAVRAVPAAVEKGTAPNADASATDTQSAQDRLSSQVADALGEAAILLNTVQVQGRRFGGPSGGRGPRPPGATDDATSGRRGGPPPNVPSGGFSGERVVLQPPRVQTPGQPVLPDVPLLVPVTPGVAHVGPVSPANPASPRSGRPTSLASASPAGRAAPPSPGATISGSSGPASSAPTSIPAAGGVGPAPADGIQIDLTEIRRDLYRQILPNAQADSLTPEERQRVAQQVNQRMLGIVEGIKLSAAELQKKADEARRKSAGAAAAAAAAPASSRSATLQQSAPAVRATTPAPPPVTSSVRVLSAPNAATTRTAALSGNQLNVRFERDGQVVRTINAEINVPNLMMTVFSSMTRQQGEVPFAVDREGRIYAQTDDDRHEVEALGEVIRPEAPIGTFVLHNWIVVTTAGPAGSALRFGIMRPVGQSLVALREAAGRNAGFGLVFIALALVVVVPLSARLTRNLSTLTDGVRRIAHGEYATRVAVRSTDEMGALARAFNQMAADVEAHQRSAVEQERIRRELELGRQIQHDMLPHGPLEIGGTEIRGASVAAREVGGDFFNYFELPSGQVALLIGDVSGKGVGAALLMANLQASLRTRLSLGQGLTAVADAIDREIERTAELLYATLFIGMFDPATRAFRYVNCGHHPQFVLRHDGAVVHMASTGLPVGLLAGRGYEEGDVTLGSGDRLFFYTDGCVEAENDADDMFGAERLEVALLSAASLDPADALAAVEHAVDEFRGARELNDDVTAMAARIG